MAAEINRRTLANLRSVEAGLHMHRRADAVRSSTRSAADSASGTDGGRARRIDAQRAKPRSSAWWIAVRRAAVLPLLRDSSPLVPAVRHRACCGGRRLPDRRRRVVGGAGERADLP